MSNHCHHDQAQGGCFICEGAQWQADTPECVQRRQLLKASLAAPLALAPAFGAAAQGSTVGPPKSGSFVINAGAALVLRDGDIAVDHDVWILVRDGLIEAVARKPIRGFEVVDARKQLLVPGFISGHTHAASATPTRGIIEMGRSFARPLELVETLSGDELDALTAFNVMELLLGGATTHLEMSLSLRQAQSYVRVATRWGVRGYPGGMVPGIARLFPIWFRGDDQVLKESVAGTLEEIEANLSFARGINGSADGRILPQVTPHATDTQTPETMRAHAAAAAELGNGIHIHLSQSGRETETVKRLWGMTPTAWCKQFGFFDGPFFGAHMVGLDFEVDPPLLNAAGAVYAHCPSGGGAGGPTQPYPEALAAGMNVNIGIDTHSNDYLENLKLAVLYGQARESLIAETSPVPLKKPTIWDAVRGATLGAANGLGREDIGRISPGAKADLVGIDVSGPLVGTGAFPPEPLSNLLYANGLSTRMVMTDGMFQVFDGQFVADDATRVALEGGEVVREIWSRLAAEGWFD
jgi:cytosine/adenosine deaminase-related metal-dependent hydrolase